jgi:hypothetical protein
LQESLHTTQIIPVEQIKLPRPKSPPRHESAQVLAPNLSSSNIASEIKAHDPAQIGISKMMLPTLPPLSRIQVHLPMPLFTNIAETGAEKEVRANTGHASVHERPNSKQVNKNKISKAKVSKKLQRPSEKVYQDTPISVVAPPPIYQQRAHLLQVEQQKRVRDSGFNFLTPLVDFLLEQRDRRLEEEREWTELMTRTLASVPADTLMQNLNEGP